MELPAQNDVDAAWREVRAELRRALGDSMYAVWIEPLALHSVQGTTLLIKAPAETEKWLRGRYGRVLEACLRRILGEQAQFAFVGANASAGDSGELATTSPDQATRYELALDTLNPRYSFEQFIIGDTNQLAHAAALAVAEHPGQAYNPLFLYASPGLGKTHLLHAIGNYVLAYGGGARVRYTTAEAFTNHFITALNSRSIDRFKQAYRDTDVLLIDDVQFLASKVRTEEEFFHTFNALYETGRQLVLTCDRLPAQLDGVEERLRERFEAGLVADIQPPNLSTRVAILRKRAALDRVPLAEPEVLELIAERVRDNVRALQGALIRVVAFHSLTGQPIDTALAQEALDRLAYPTAGDDAAGPARELSVEAVKQAVAAYAGVSMDELISPSRTARVAWPRQLAIYLARELTGSPTTAIGHAFGGRNHATVLHACKRVVARLSDDPQTAVDIDELTRQLRGVAGDRSC